MNTIGQIGAVTALGLRTIPSRRGASLVVVLGMACAVGALISILSLSAGLMRTIEGTGRADRVIVLSQNSLYEFGSSLPRASATIIADAPGIKRDATGKPLVSAEILAYASVIKKSNGLDAFVTVRGIGPEGMALRPEMKLISGRMFRPGKYEVIVGKSAASQFAGLDLGKQIALPQGDWTVTGIFESEGSARQSEVVADAATLYAAMRASAYKSMTVQLVAPSAFARFKSALTSNPALVVDVTTESELLARDWKFLNTLLGIVAYMVGGIMGLGAMFGALNTMYSAVSARNQEIATLRALGFGGGAVVVSVLAESLLLAVSGSIFGAALAWIAFNGNLHAMGGLVISLAVTPMLVMCGIGFGCALGLVGGLMPALRAVRLSVAVALRAT